MAAIGPQRPPAAYSLVVVLGCCATAWNLCSTVSILNGDCTDRMWPTASLRPFGNFSGRLGRASPGHNSEVTAGSALGGVDTGYFYYVTEGSAGGTERTPKAHLGSKFFKLSPQNSTVIERWSVDQRIRSYAIGNVSASSQGLLVPETGYYFVYSQVGFVLARRDYDSSKAVILHEIVRNSNATGPMETLLKAEKTHCWSQKPLCSLESSYLAAVLPLSKGDKLTAKVSDVNFIWQSYRRTTIGLFSVD